MTKDELDCLFKLSHQFSVKRKTGAPVTYIVDFDLWREKYIQLRGKKRITVW